MSKLALGGGCYWNHGAPDLEAYDTWWYEQAYRRPHLPRTGAQTWSMKRPRREVEERDAEPAELE